MYKVIIPIGIVFMISSIMKPVGAAHYFNLGPAHYCQMCNTAMTWIEKALTPENKWERSESVLSAIYSTCLSNRFPGPLEDGMIKKNRSNLKTFIIDKGVKDLGKRFCEDIVVPKACPPIEESPITFDVHSTGDIKYDHKTTKRAKIGQQKYDSTMK